MGRAKHRKHKNAGTKTRVSLDTKLPSRRPPDHTAAGILLRWLSHARAQPAPDVRVVAHRDAHVQAPAVARRARHHLLPLASRDASTATL